MTLERHGPDSQCPCVGCQEVIGEKEVLMSKG